MRVSFNININDWRQRATNIFTNDTKRLININERKLKEAFEKSASTEIRIEDKLKKEIIYNFKLLIRNINPSAIKFFDSKKKARLLASLLLTDAELADIDIMNHAKTITSIFSDHPSSRLAPYLLNVLLNNYGHNNYNIFYDLLKNILVEYTGKTSIFRSVKNNINLFNPENGTIIAANLCINNQMSLLEFIHSIGLSDNLNSKYISALFLKVTIRHDNQNTLHDHLDELIDFANSTVDHDTAKLFFATLIIHVDESNLIDKKKYVKDNAYKTIGDPILESNWFIADVNDYDKDKLLRAKNILNIWLNELLIEMFFNYLTIDLDRKQFWLKYSDKIYDMKICVTENAQRRLSHIDKINNFMKGRVKTLSNGSGDESILLMKTKTHLFIESTVIGTAFYAYRLNSSHCPNTDWSFISKPNLINPQMPPLFRNQYYTISDIKTEGRRAHIPTDLWPDLIGYWIDSYGGIN